MCGATTSLVIIHFALDISFSTLECDYSRIVHALVILMDYVMSWSDIIELYMYIRVHPFLATDMEEEEEEGEEGERLVTPLGEDLVTLSTLPKSRWSNLQNLDVIKVCACKSPPTQDNKANNAIHNSQFSKLHETECIS